MRDYQHLTDDRRKHIDLVTDFLHKQYSTGEGINWRQVADDFGYTFLHSNCFLEPTADRLILSDSQGQIVMYKRFISVPKSLGNNVIAHEFAHHILGHFGKNLPKQVSEDESNYFAEILEGEITSEEIDNFNKSLESNPVYQFIQDLEQAMS